MTNTRSLNTSSDAYSFGIEEEYFLVCKSSRDLEDLSKGALLTESALELGSTVSGEMLQSQIEIATSVLLDTAQARRELTHARSVLSRRAAAYGMAIMASGTHPLGVWKDQRVTDRPRYLDMQEELQIVGRRNVLCGLHVHVQPPPNASRIDLINRLLPYLPALLALSTSSPFWQAHATGMKGYRLAAYDELPRTGLPPVFRNDGEYKLFTDALVSSGAIPDQSHIWWAIRPSAKFPTIELRIADSCTHLEDTLCIAALFRCLVRCVSRASELNARMDSMWRHVVEENRWRAQRFGVDGSFIDLDKTRLTPIVDTIDQILEMIHADAQALDCVAEVQHARQIISRGTSADQQLRLYKSLREGGKTRPEALEEVVDWLVSSTAGTS